jgi:hypothetical protein
VPCAVRVVARARHRGPDAQLRTPDLVGDPPEAPLVTMQDSTPPVQQPPVTAASPARRSRMVNSAGVSRQHHRRGTWAGRRRWRTGFLGWRRRAPGLVPGSGSSASRGHRVVESDIASCADRAVRRSPEDFGGTGWLPTSGANCWTERPAGRSLRERWPRHGSSPQQAPSVSWRMSSGPPAARIGSRAARAEEGA